MAEYTFTLRKNEYRRIRLPVFSQFKVLQGRISTTAPIDVILEYKQDDKFKTFKGRTIFRLLEFSMKCFSPKQYLKIVAKKKHV